jgi:hypothetical protein
MRRLGLWVPSMGNAVFIRYPSAAYDVQGMGQRRAENADQAPKKRLQFRHHPDCGTNPNRAEEYHGERCHIAWREQAEANQM